MRTAPNQWKCRPHACRRGLNNKTTLAGQRIDAREVRTLVKIASLATPTSVVCVIGAAVLACHDMFDVNRRGGRCKVWQVAVFTTRAGALTNELTKRRHCGSFARLRSARAFACRMAMKSMVWT